jgi:hypothetical protein
MEIAVQLPDDEVAFISAAAKWLGLDQGEVIRIAMGLFRDEVGMNGRDHVLSVGRAKTPPWASELDSWFADKD